MIFPEKEKTRLAGAGFGKGEMGSYRSHSTTTPRKNQATFMGSALRALLSRYKTDLLQHEDEAGERTGQEVDCIDFLLIESDRRQKIGGGR